MKSEGPHYKLLSFFLLLITILLTPACHLIAPQCDRPPMIMIHSSIYQGSGKISQLPSNSIYLGIVTSSVSSSKSPTQDFQTNDEFVGDQIYQIAENKVVINHKNQWFVYYRID